MLNCDDVRDLLPLLHYEALDGQERRRVLDHLGTCALCAGRFEETRRTLLAITAASAFPREHEVDWTAFARETARKARDAARLRPVSPPVPKASRRALLRGGLLGVAVAAALLALVALPLWREASRPAPAPVAAGESDAALVLQRGLARRGAERSLREGRAVLLDLMETPVRCRKGDGGVDVALEKERARDLLRRLGVQSQSLLDPGDRRLQELMGALQDLLLDVSALDDCTAGAQLRALREAIERRQLLMRIDLMVGEAGEGGRRA